MKISQQRLGCLCYIHICLSTGKFREKQLYLKKRVKMTSKLSNMTELETIISNAIFISKSASSVKHHLRTIIDNIH